MIDSSNGWGFMISRFEFGKECRVELKSTERMMELIELNEKMVEFNLLIEACGLMGR